MSVEQLNFPHQEQNETSELQEKNSYMRFLMREVFEEIRKIDLAEKNKAEHSLDLDSLHQLMKIWPLNYFNEKYDKDLTKQQVQTIVKEQINDSLDKIFINKTDLLQKDKISSVLQNTVDLAAKQLVDRGIFTDDESTKYIPQEVREGKLKKVDIKEN